MHGTPTRIRQDPAGAPCVVRRALMVTVEVDSACVESRLAGGEISCPSCSEGVLAGWGFARPRRIVGVAAEVRPRRSRCRGCAVTHVLLPVPLLLRRAYLAELIWAALVAKARGGGHRPIAQRLGIPATTVRGWLRVMAGRCGAVRNWFLNIAVTAGIDVSIPKASGSACGDVLTAVEAARAAICARFGGGWIVGVTAAEVSVAGSGGLLLSPSWPPVVGLGSATRTGPAIAAEDPSSSRV